LKIDEAGVLDAYVLPNRVYVGIAQDASAYRAANRDKLYRYPDEFLVPRTPNLRSNANKSGFYEPTQFLYRNPQNYPPQPT
jgi:hypothetical protein